MYIVLCYKRERERDPSKVCFGCTAKKMYMYMILDKLYIRHYL
jgi:hypothetical protein